MLVDDERESIEPLRQILSHYGYVIYCAETGEAALIEYESKLPDVVLMDVRLPGIDGVEACRQLVAKYGEACAPIILMSGHANLLTDSPDFPLGVVDFLAKPFRPNEALVHIRAHLENRRYAMRQKVLAEELSRSNVAKNKFLGMCAHDLSSPLASIRGMAEFLQDHRIGSLNEKQSQLVATIHEASQTMLTLVNELLDITAIESGEVHLNLAPTPLRTLIARAIDVAATPAARKRMSIHFHPSPTDPIIQLDTTRIRQVVDNLLSNAIKYSRPGSVITVSLELPEATAENQVVRVCVQDNGPGILEAERSKLFTVFGRLSSLPTGGERANGIGLSICRTFVEAHGGTIEAVNQSGGGGCIFCFTLPLSPCT